MNHLCFVLFHHLRLRFLKTSEGYISPYNVMPCYFTRGPAISADWILMLEMMNFCCCKWNSITMRALAIAPDPPEQALIFGKLGARARREKYMVTFLVFQSIKFSTSTWHLLWKCKKYRFLSLNLNFLSYLIPLIFPPSQLITPRHAERNPVTSLTFRRHN